MQTLDEVLLTRDPEQRTRLSQTLIAMSVLACGVLGMLYFAWIGVAPAWPVGLWSLSNLLVMGVFFVLIRGGWSKRLREPSMSLQQMVFALSSGAVAYAFLGSGRGAVFPVVMVVMMFGLFAASPRQMRWLSAYTVVLFGAVMAGMSMLRPRDYPPQVELGHFLIVATMLPAASLLAARLSRMRERARRQQAELSQALAREREHATRDDQTGLLNKRHMQQVMDQEHQRCVRSGQTFCLAMFDIDQFKRINEAHSCEVGDMVLRAVAEEAQRQVRGSDMLARWGSDNFVLMMSDTRSVLARSGLERLHQRVAALRILNGGVALNITLSGGLAEHLAGETVAQTLARAEQALDEAKTQGRNLVVVAT